MKSPCLLLALWASLLPGANADAQRSAVLVGDVAGNTFLIAHDSGRRVRIMKADSVLIVPRADGFWKVGQSVPRVPSRPASDSAAADSTTGSAPDAWFALALWAVPLKSPAPQLVYADSVSDVDYDREAGGTRQIWVRFLSPTTIAIEEDYEIYSGTPVYGDIAEVAPLDTLIRYPYMQRGRPLASSPFAFDSSTTDQFAVGCRKQYEEADDDGFDIPADFVLDQERQELISRAQGRWRLNWLFNISSGAARGYSFMCELPVILPVKMTGHDILKPAWNEISSQIEKAEDAISSPGGDMVVVHVEGALRVFLPTARGLGTPVAEVRPFTGPITMAQWASGQHAARWLTELSSVMRPSVPAPR